MNNQFRSTSTRQIANLNDLRIEAKKLKLTKAETDFFEDLIIDLFPISSNNYVHTWAMRIQHGTEYQHACGNTRAWMNDNPLYDRVKEERATKGKTLMGHMNEPANKCVCHLGVICQLHCEGIREQS